MAILTVVFLILFALVFIGILLYNGLVSRRIGAENAWSQIDVQLKRRHDLIPNLVETVKGYAAHEKETLEKVIQARNHALSSMSGSNMKDLVQAENMLSGALKQLFALSESYPDLKANQNFLQLQEEIGSTENRIGFARQHFNDSVASFNQATETFPSVIVARMFNFSKKSFFELDAAEVQAVRTAPKVSF